MTATDWVDQLPHNDDGETISTAPAWVVHDGTGGHVFTGPTAQQDSLAYMRATKLVGSASRFPAAMEC